MQEFQCPPKIITGDGSAGTSGFGTTPVSASGVDIGGKIGGHAATAAEGLGLKAQDRAHDRR